MLVVQYFNCPSQPDSLSIPPFYSYPMPIIESEFFFGSTHGELFSQIVNYTEAPSLLACPGREGGGQGLLGWIDRHGE